MTSSSASADSAAAATPAVPAASAAALDVAPATATAAATLSDKIHDMFNKPKYMPAHDAFENPEETGANLIQNVGWRISKKREEEGYPEDLKKRLQAELPEAISTYEHLCLKLNFTEFLHYKNSSTMNCFGLYLFLKRTQKSLVDWTEEERKEADEYIKMYLSYANDACEKVVPGSTAFRF